MYDSFMTFRYPWPMGAFSMDSKYYLRVFNARGGSKLAIKEAVEKSASQIIGELRYTTGQVTC